MNKLLIALIAGGFAATVAAQGTMPGETPKDKQKQNTVKSVTEGSTETGENRAQQQKGVAEAKATKGTPKDLPTHADKRKAVDATTSGSTTTSANRSQEAAGVADAKATQGPAEGAADQARQAEGRRLDHEEGSEPLSYARSIPEGRGRKVPCLFLFRSAPIVTSRFARATTVHR